MLKINDVLFKYDNKYAVSGISFSLEKGKNLALIGESGCGKSTLLKLIYGLFDLEEGTIFWKDLQVLGPKYNLIPGMHYMKYLAQDFDLMPYITVAENVGKYLSNFYPEKKKERIFELLEIVEMTEYANVKAQFLSGGQMQCVALARVLALEPEVLLLDEPFSHIDNFRKNSLRRNIFKYLKEKEITTIIATHDSTDVLSFADEMIVMKNGSIVNKGLVNQVYNEPKDFYTASLFGDVNEIVLNGKKQFIYPHQFIITESSDLKVTVTKSYYKGSHYLNEAIYENGKLYFESDKDFTGSLIFLKIKTT
jgi:ABC-type sulfate/molybdate transport systems ATPase subunit